MQRDAAMCGYLTNDYIIKGTCYADEEREKIVMETDPKNRRKSLCEKINKTCKKVFQAAAVEFPSGKGLYTGLVVDMNDAKDNGAEK